MSPLRSWVAVHAFKPALALFTVFSVAASAGPGWAVLPGTWVDTPGRVPMTQILAVSLGVTVGIGATSGVDPAVTRLAGPSWRVFGARAVWCCTLVAAALAVTALTARGEYGPAAAASTCAASAGLALLALAAGWPELSWVVPVTVTAIGLRFGWGGTSHDDWHWWAVFLSPHVGPLRASLAIALLAAGVAGACARDHIPGGPTRRRRPSPPG